ncbi:MAG: U32 family peptidase [Candidatus Omnitrophica bacterium]|nr:U32 family peptidase [Candidatus Omnitrophota bacterium]
MKILSPFSKKEEVMPLIEAGADELYCGIIPEEWENRYSAFDTLNRREGYAANFSKFSDLQYAIQLAHRENVRVFVTMNGLYVQQQYPLIRKIIKKLKDVKADGLIIADIGLLLMLQRMKIFKEIHIGAGGTTFNSKTAIFYKKFGASRIILPRHLTINEIEDISRRISGKVHLEVFILNTLCPNVDGFCTFYHGMSFDKKAIAPEIDLKNKKIKFTKFYAGSHGGCACVLRYSKRIFDNRGKRITRQTPSGTKKIKHDRENRKECGACAIFDFNKMNIRGLKIVERGAKIESKIRDTKFIRAVLDILKKEDNSTKEKFIKKTQKLYCDTYKYDKCSGFSCYYPSVFHKTLHK